jgi:hypothetical protein
MVINHTKKTDNCNSASSVLWKQMCEGEATKREADKHEFHPKNFYVASSFIISKI